MKKPFLKRINMLGFCLHVFAMFLVLSSFGHAQTASYTPVDVRWGWNDPDWSSERAVLMKHLVDFKSTSTSALSRYGGDMSRTVEATGHFRTERINSRWMFVDPEGHPFISMGICTVKPLISPDLADMEPFQRLFGSNMARWAAQVSQQFDSAHLNTLACWSDWKSFSQIKKPKPYTIAIELLSGFAKSIQIASSESPDSAIPEKMLPVFHPGFPTYCSNMVRTEILPYADDPYLLGVFTDNEIKFNPRALDVLLLAPPKDYGHMAAIKWLRQRYPRMTDPAQAVIGDADRRDFLNYFAATYYRIVHDAMSRQAPAVLNLSSRIDYEHAYMEPVMQAAAAYCDVLAINWYGVFDPDPLVLEKWADWTGDKPFIVSEFYAKGSDVGFTNRGGMGIIVRTQEDRAAFYEHYALRLLRSANCIGWHWYCYNNTSRWQALQVFGSGNNAGHDSNKGFVDYEYSPYKPLADAMARVNGNVYNLEQYFEVKNQALQNAPPGTWIEREKLNASHLPTTQNWAISFGDSLTTLSSSSISEVVRQVDGGFEVGNSRGVSLVRTAPLKGGARICCRIRLLEAGDGGPILVLHGGKKEAGYSFALGLTTASLTAVSRNGDRIRGCGFLLDEKAVQTLDLSSTFLDGNSEIRLSADGRSWIGFRDDRALKGSSQPGVALIMPPNTRVFIEEFAIMQSPI